MNLFICVYIHAMPLRIPGVHQQKEDNQLASPECYLACRIYTYTSLSLYIYIYINIPLYIPSDCIWLHRILSNLSHFPALWSLTLSLSPYQNYAHALPICYDTYLFHRSHYYYYYYYLFVLLLLVLLLYYTISILSYHYYYSYHHYYYYYYYYYTADLPPGHHMILGDGPSTTCTSPVAPRAGYIYIYIYIYIWISVYIYIYIYNNNTLYDSML